MDQAEVREFLEILEFSITDRPPPLEIKRRWKSLCKKHHPDIGGKESKFREITHAYKMLTDAEYATKNKPMVAKNLDLRIQFGITFEEAFAGTKVVMNYAVTEVDAEFNIVKKEKIELESIILDLQAGSFSTDVIKVPGKGLRKGDKRGDAYLLPQIGSHPRFKAQRSIAWGWDIVVEENIPLHTMLTGGKVDVLTMRGIKTLKVPTGTNPGALLRILGGGCCGGDHVVVVSPVYPNKTELKGSKWSGLSIEWGDEEYIDEEEDSFLRLNERLMNSFR